MWRDSCDHNNTQHNNHNHNYNTTWHDDSNHDTTIIGLKRPLQVLSMSQGGFSSKGPEVESLKTIGMPFCAASMPAHSVSRSACFGLRSPSDGLPYGASSPPWLA